MYPAAVSTRLPTVVVALLLALGCDRAASVESAQPDASAGVSDESRDAAVGDWHARVEWPLAFRSGFVGQYDYELTLWPDGRTRWESSECFESIGDGDGSWRETAPGVFAVQRHDGEELRLLWASWGPRRYLVPESLLADDRAERLLENIESTREAQDRQPSGFEFKRKGDWELAATGALVFPAAAAELVGETRVRPPTGDRWVGPGQSNL